MNKEKILSLFQIFIIRIHFRYSEWTKIVRIWGENLRQFIKRTKTWSFGGNTKKSF